LFAADGTSLLGQDAEKKNGSSWSERASLCLTPPLKGSASTAAAGEANSSLSAKYFHKTRLNAGFTIFGRQGVQKGGGSLTVAKFCVI
jgi:hypothetical protein